MKNYSKRLFSLLLALAMVFTMLPVSALADEAAVSEEEQIIEPVVEETPDETATMDAADLETALTDGGEVALTGNVLLSKQIVIPEGVEVVLDLNGFEINTVEESAGKHLYALDNWGTLTITGEGSINARGIYNGRNYAGEGKPVMTIEDNVVINGIDVNGGYAVSNYGMLYLNGGELNVWEDDPSDAASSGNYDATALNNVGTAVLNGGKLTSTTNFTYAISNSGTLTVPENSTLEVTGAHGALSVSGGSVEINGGEFVCSGVTGSTDNVLYIYGGSVEINDGSFIHEGDAVNADSGAAVVMSGASAALTINDGEFVGLNGTVSGNANTVINGGSYDNVWNYDGWDNISNYVPVGTVVTVDGKPVIKNEDGTMSDYKDPVATVNGVGYGTVQEAVDAANAGDEVVITAAVSDEAVTVNKNLTISGSATLNNVSITGANGIDLAVEGLSFTGNSWIDSCGAASLTVSGVTANVAPSNTAATNSRGAFISLGRSEQANLKLTVEDSNIVTKTGTDAILGWAAVTEVALTDNVFGSESAYFNNGDAVKFMSIADGAVFTITGNSCYSNYNGIVFAQNTTRGNAYTVIAEDNKFFGGADHLWIEVSGASTIHATIKAASNNTVNGNALTRDDIKYWPSNATWTSYAGVDVELDENGKIVGGVLTAYNEDCLADGVEVDANGNIKKYVAVLAGNTAKFENLNDAFTVEHNPDNKSIIMVADCEQDVVITSGQSYTFYLDGYDLTGSFKLVDGVVNFNDMEGNYGGSDGGKVIATGLNGDYPIYCENGQFNLNGGEFIATAENGTALYSEGNKLNINGDVTVTGNIETANGGIMSVSAGTFYGAAIKGAGSDLNITAGSFSVDPTNVLTKGYQATLTDGMYVVKAKEIGSLNDLATDENGAYLLSTAEDVVLFRELLAVGNKSTFSGLTFKVTNNIDMAGIVLDPSGDNDHRFAGTFDGQNYTISNVVIEGAETNQVAFIGNVSGATIKNVTLHNVKATGAGYTAALVGYSRKSTITDCRVTGEIEITGANSVAAIHAGGVIEITNCEVNATGTIRGNYNVGVISGLVSENSTKISNNTVTGVTVEGLSLVGGLVGTVIPSATGVTVDGNVVTKTTVVSNGDYADCCGLIVGATQTKPEGYSATYSKNYARESTLTEAGVAKKTLYSLSYTNGASPNVSVESGLQGSGTAEDPYLINDIDELKWFRDNVNTYTQDGSNQYKGKYIKLMADIDLAGENWEPIGKNAKGDHQNFLGTFDGNNHTISNLTIASEKGGSLGFFANTGSFNEAEKAEVKNLKFHNVDVAAAVTYHWSDGHGDYVGGVIANAGGNTFVSNVHVTGDVYISGCGYVGGIVGHGYPKIDNCSVIAEEGSWVHGGYWSVGGILGFGGEGDGATKVTNCEVANLNIWGAYGAAASIVGNARNGAIGENLKATNIQITGSDYALGYVFGNSGTVTNVTLKNVTIPEGATGCDMNIAATIGEDVYFSLKAALAAAKDGDTIVLAATTIEEGEIVLPHVMNNITIQGAADHKSILKNTVLAERDNNKVINGLTIDGVVFENGGLLLVEWGNAETLKDITINNCKFLNLDNTGNQAPVHLNVGAAQPIENFTFTNNVIDGATGGSKSGIYSTNTGVTTISGNVINNVAFRPYIINIVANDGIADELNVTGNTFSGSAVGRPQALTNGSSGTDAVKLVFTENIVTDVTDAQYLCYWSFNPETTTTDFSKNYYDIDLAEKYGKFYYNTAASSQDDLVDMGIYPIYTRLNDDGTIDLTSIDNGPFDRKINSVEELQMFADLVNAGNTFAGKTITLEADLDLSGIDFTPIGNGSNPFNGMFDGKGHTISNLTISGDTSYVSGGANDNYKGLFGYMKGGNTAGIKNLNLVNADVTGCLYVGTVLGRSYTGGIIENCHVSGIVNVDAYAYAGGLVGRHEYSAGANAQGDTMSIYNCSVDGTDASMSAVTCDYAVSYVGGIVGFLAEGKYIVDACSAKNITINGIYGVGGISGIAHYGNELTTASVDGVKVISANNDKDSARTANVGLIAGACQGTASEPSVIRGTVANTTAAVSYTDGTTAQVTDLFGNTMTGATPVTNYVAELNGEIYESLQAAFDVVADGETIKLIRDVNVTEAAYGQNAVNYDKAVDCIIDLNGCTLSANTGNSVFRFNIAASGATSDVTVTLKNGTVIAGANTWCAVMAAGISSNVKAIFNLEDLTVEGSKAGDLLVKSWDNAVVNAKNVTVNATKGAGGFYALGGEIVLDDCVVNQKGLHTAPYLSMALAVSNNGKMTVNSGTYTAEPTAAAEGYNQGTSHGSWVAGVMNSGGTLIINGGTFANGNYGDDELATAARGLILCDTAGNVEINDGTFRALKCIIDIQNNLGDVNNNPSVVLYGGNYSADPTVSASYGSELIEVAEGYEVAQNPDGTWGLKAALEAMIITSKGPRYYGSVDAALAAAKDGDTIIMLANAYLGKMDITKNVTIDLSGMTVTATKEIAFNADLTIKNGNLCITGAKAAGDALFRIGNAKTSTVTLDEVNVYGDGYSSAYAVFYVYGESTLNINGGSVVVANEQHASGGVFKASNGANGKINITDATLSFTDAKIGFLDGTVVLDNVDLDIVGGANAINQTALTVKDSTVTITNPDGRALTLKQGDVNIINSTLEFSGATEGEIRFKDGCSLNLDATSNMTECKIYADEAAQAAANVNGIIIHTGEDKMATGSVVNGVPTIDIPWNEKTIATVQDLYDFAEAVNAGNTYRGKTITMVADIDLEDAEFTPIGYMGASFQGTFDGNGHTISNLTITKGLENTSANNGVGLFGKLLDTAEVKNLTIENVDITGSLYVGAIAGYAYTGKAITNCTVKGDIAIDAYWYAGVIGGNGYLSIVDNCHVIGNDGSYIKGNNGSYIGGIWGFRGEGSQKITNCSVTNLEIIGVDRVGAISGMLHYQNEISGCAATNVTVKATDPEATTVGLIAGACQGTDAYVSIIRNNTVTDVKAYAGETEVTNIYGTNINGTAGVTNFVAQVNGELYEDLGEAMKQDGEVVLIRNMTISETITVTNDVVLNLNGKTITISGVESARAIVLADGCIEFVINGNGGKVVSADAKSYGFIEVKTNADLTVNGGTYDVDTNNGSVFKYRDFQTHMELNDVVMESNGQLLNPQYSGSTLTVNGGTFKAESTYNGRNVLAIYAASGATVVLNDMTMVNRYMGGVEAAGNSDVTLNNCDITINGINTAVYQTVAVGVNSNGKATINGGNYTVEPLAAADANGQGTTHGSWTLCLMNSGATMIINDGTFSNGNYGDDALATNAREVISVGALEGKTSNLEINGGTFNSIGALLFNEAWNPGTNNVTIVNGVFNMKAFAAQAQDNLKAEVYGGIYTVEVPSEFCADGYACVPMEDGRYNVKVALEAMVVPAKGVTKFYSTLAEALAAANDGDTVMLMANAAASKLALSKDITIDLMGTTLTMTSGGNTINGNVTIKNGTINIDGLDSKATANSNCIFSVNVDGELTFEEINLVGENYTTAWAVICAMSSSTAGGTFNMIESTVTLSNELGSAGGFIKDQSGVDNLAVINITDSTLNLTDVSRGFTGGKVNLDNVDLTITGGEHGINGAELTAVDSRISITDGIGRALTLSKFDASFENCELVFDNMGEDEIRFKTGNALTLEGTTLNLCDVYADKAGATVNGKVVTGTENKTSTLVADGTTATLTNPAVAQVGETKYESLEEAVAAADEVTLLDNVTAEVTIDKVMTIVKNGFTANIKAAEGLYVYETADAYEVKVAVLPNATINDLGKITVDEYTIFEGKWPPVEASKPMDLQIALEFIANDTAEEAAANGYADYTTDFFIKLDGMAGESFVANGCYLAGNYGTYGWIQIPLDGMTIEEGVVYNMITSFDFNFTYEDICTTVKDFKCGIYLTDEILEANPDLKVTLELGLSEDLKAAQAKDYIVVGEAMTYDVDDLANAVEKFNIIGANMTLGNDLKINFLIEKEDMRDGYVAMISQAGAEAKEVAIEVYNDDYYKAAFSVAAKEMTDDLSVVIVDADGKEVSNVYTRTIMDYAMTLMAVPNAKLKSVVVDMLNYGTEAQKYFHFNEDAYANAKLTDEQQAEFATGDVEVTDIRELGANCAGTNLSLEASILMNAFFRSSTTEGMTATVSFIDYKGNEVNVTADVIQNSAALVKVVVDEIVLADAKRPVTITVYKDGAEFGTCVESVASYVARNLSNETMGAINSAIIKFATSAYSYLNGTH